MRRLNVDNSPISGHTVNPTCFYRKVETNNQKYLVYASNTDFATIMILPWK